MKKSLIILIAAVIFSAPRHARCEETRIDLPVAEAVAMALSRNLDLRVEQLNAEINEAELARSRGIYNPVLTASAAASRLDLTSRVQQDALRISDQTYRVGVSQLIPTGATLTVEGGVTSATTRLAGVDSDSDDTVYFITLSQPLLNNAGKQMTDFSINVARYLLDDSLERYRFVAADTASGVISAYNRLYALRQQLESRRLSLDAARLVLDETRAQVAAGTIAAMEITSAEFGVVQRQKDLIDAERAVSDQVGLLRVMTGIEGRSEIVPRDPPMREEVDLTEREALAKALELRGDIKQLRNLLKLSELQEKFARNQILPKVDLFGTYAKRSVGTATVEEGVDREVVESSGSRSWSASLNLSYPLGNAAAKQEYRKNRLRTEQLRQQIAALSRRIENEVETDFRALISARLQIRAADKSREYAEQRLLDYREKKSRGAATAKEVLDVENELANARFAQVEAAQTYADAVIKLRRDVGVLLDHLGVRIDTTKPSNLMNGKS